MAVRDMPERDHEFEHAAPRLRQPGFWHYVAVAPTWVAAFVLFVMMGMTFLDVILRSAFDNPLEYATELTRIFMAIIVFASLPMVSWKGQHIIVDLMDPLFSMRAARVRDILIDLICGAALLWPAKRVWDLAERSRDFGDVTEYMGFPQHLIEWFIAAFTAIAAVTFIARGLLRIFAPGRVPG